MLFFSWRRRRRAAVGGLVFCGADMLVVLRWRVLLINEESRRKCCALRYCMKNSPLLLVAAKWMHPWVVVSLILYRSIPTLMIPPSISSNNLPSLCKYEPCKPTEFNAKYLIINFVLRDTKAGNSSFGPEYVVQCLFLVWFENSARLLCS